MAISKSDLLFLDTVRAIYNGDECAKDKLLFVYRTGQKFDEAFCLLKEMALKDIDFAFYWVGRMYKDGRGVKKADYIKATYWLEKAAALKNAEAQYFLGTVYENEKAECYNREKAFEWYLRSYSNGYDRAGYKAGFAFENGWATKQNYMKAAEAYHKAYAFEMNAQALERLEYLYSHGLISHLTRQNEYKYYKKIIEKKYNIMPIKWPTFMVRIGALLGLECSIDRLVSLLLQKNDYATLGKMYLHGKFVKQDLNEALGYLKTAADVNHDMTAGDLYYYGNYTGIPKDLIAAYKWYSIAYCWNKNEEERAIIAAQLSLVENEMSSEQLEYASCITNNYLRDMR